MQLESLHGQRIKKGTTRGDNGAQGQGLATQERRKRLTVFVVRSGLVLLLYIYSGCGRDVSTSS